MTKKEFIEKIKKGNKRFRVTLNEKQCRGVYINGVYFFYDSVKLCFDDDLHQLFIFDRNKRKIIASIFYNMIQIGL